MSLTRQDIIRQSTSALNQWGNQWGEQALHHKTHHEKFVLQDLKDFENSGIGSACLLVANGYSYEKNIETIKKHQDNVDIFACDKTLGTLIDNGITPDYCIVCDANVSYEKYLEPWKDKLQNTVVFQNICANPKWVDNGNWKNKYFFVNQDVLKSEKKWMEISGCKNSIPAGTNVSNAMIVFVTQSNNDGRRNFFGYDKILLIGFDYSWTAQGKYYAFNKEANGKNNYMRHVYGKNMNGDLCFTSNNLSFSSQWGQTYINTFKLPVIQCSRDTIFRGKSIGVLEEQMSYNYKKEDSTKVREIVSKRQKLMETLKSIDLELRSIGTDHFMKMMQTS